MRTATILVLVILQAVCTHDLSTTYPYATFVGRDVTLQKAVSLNPDNAFNPSDGEVLLSYAWPSTAPRKLPDLPAGTILHVTRVIGHDGLMPAVTAYGTANHPNNNLSFAWRYQWGIAVTLYRAPWEDSESVPEVRRFHKGGRVVTRALKPRNPPS